MRYLFILIFLFSFALNLSSQENDLYSLMKERNEFYFSFKCEPRRLVEMMNLVSIDKVDGDSVVAYANNEEYEMFLKSGIETMLLTPPSMLEVHAMYDAKTREEYEWDEYPTYEAYETMMKNYAETYSDKCSLMEFGTLESGRKLLLIRINDDETIAKPKVLLTSTIHGDETTGYIMMLRLIDELLTAEGLPEVNNVRNNIDLFICPNANPDGTYRKGNHTVNGATRSNAFGIDMNRNYPDRVEGNHPDGKKYALETELFMELADEYQFTMAANYHGGAEVINYPWDNSKSRHVDDKWWQMISRQYADLAQEENSDYMTDRDNGITNGADWYMIYGSRQDYMNYYQQCRELTVECSTTKCPPASDLPMYWNYNRNSIYAFLNQVLFGIHGTVKDAVTQDPLQASVKIINHDRDYSMVESQLPDGNFYRPIKAGVYTIEASAEGYIPKREDVAVTDNEKTIVEIQMDKYDDALDEYDDVDLKIDASGKTVYINNKFLKTIHFELINIRGQIVKNNCFDKENMELNLSELDGGVYFMNIVIGDKQMSRKIVVK